VTKRLPGPKDQVLPFSTFLSYTTGSKSYLNPPHLESECLVEVCHWLHSS